ARARPILGHRAFGQVDVDILAIEDARLDAIGRRARLHIREGRLHGFVHHIAQLAGRLRLPLAGHGDGFDGEQFATYFGPGQAGDGADLVLLLGDAVAELADAREVPEIIRRHRDAA